MINNNVCDGCRQSLDRRRRSHVELGPMLHDSIWRQIADPAEALCWECMLRRADERLGRMLTLADLRPCPFNLYKHYSWFDLFAEMEPPSNLEEWRSVSPPPASFVRAAELLREMAKNKGRMGSS